MDAIVRNRVSPLIDVRFRDIDELRSAVALWDLRFHPIQREQPVEAGRIAQFSCASVDFAYARFHTAFDQSGAPPANRITFAVFGSDLKRLWWRNQDVANDTVVVYQSGDELKSISGTDFEVYTISIAEAELEALCQSLRIPAPSAAARRETFSIPAPVAQVLRERLRSLRDDPLNFTDGEAREVAITLVSAWLSPSEALKIRRPSVRARDIALGRALEFIESTDLDSLSTDALCQVANASERTLQYAFRERFGLTPAAFIRAYRLVHARRMLVAPPRANMTVSEVLFGCGFNNRGRFSADYQRAFGELPSGTLLTRQ